MPCTATDTAQNGVMAGQSPTGPPTGPPTGRVALVLGSGGARGYAHIGVIDELRERGYEVAGVAGSSMGALVGGLHAAGSLDEFADWARTLTQRAVLRLLDPSITAAGVLRAEKILDAVRDLRAMDEKEQFRVRYNCKMTDLQAALGLSQLRKLAGFIARRREIADLYGDALRGLGLPAPSAPADGEPVWYRYVLTLDGDAGPFIEEMRRRGVECRRPVFKPLHRYLGLSGYETSEEAWRRAVSIPLYPALTAAEIETVVKALRLVLPRHCTERAQDKRPLGQASRAC